MVKGISKQVIVVHSPDRKLFEQAIFILRDDMGEGVTEEALLKEAERVIRVPQVRKNWQAPLWAAGGALATGALWLLTALL
ncbi:MAG: hypothetical protein IJZ39_03700 [Oscillospiraceae bacterium]|nr:hypothetical protein [Oscillospiraceae bacterium]